MKKLICTIVCIATVFLTGATVLASGVNKQPGDIYIPIGIEKGNVNRDKKIDNKDAELLLQYTAGWNLNVTIRKAEADLNNDGKIDGLDALQLLQKIAK